MRKDFYCSMCDVSFSSWSELKNHLVSREHKEKVRDPLARVESFLDKLERKLSQEDDNE